MFSQQEVEHIAELSRLKLTASEVKRMQKDLAAILDYIALLNELQVEKVEAMFYPSQTKNITREDKAIPQTKETVENMLKQAPESDNGFVKVKEVLK